MGYRAPTNVLNLRYEDHPGLQVQAASLPIGVFMKLARLADKLEGVDVSDLSAEDAMATLGEVEDLFRGFTDALRSWNVTDDDDEPVPATYEGLMGLDARFVLQIIGGWLGAIGSLKGPLSNGSTGGGTSPGVSVPMGPPSAGPPN